MAWLEVGGIALEGLGLLVAIVGLRTRFRDFARPGQSEFDPVKRATRHGVDAFSSSVRRRWNRLRGRPNFVNLGTATMVQAPATMKGRMRIGWSPLPTGRSNKPALAELDQRTRRIWDSLADLQEQVEDETERIDGQVGHVRTQLEAEVSRLEDQTRRLATGDVTLQYVGLGMVAIGLLIQAGAAAVSAASP